MAVPEEKDFVVLEELIEENKKAKGYCRALITRATKDKEIINKQEKELLNLKKSVNPKRAKVMLDLAAKARDSLGIKDIEKVSPNCQNKSILTQSRSQSTE